MPVKDIKGKIIKKGDLIILQYRRLTYDNAIPVVFKECNSTNDILYYPLDEYGLAKIQQDKSATVESSFYHKHDYKIKKGTKRTIIKMDTTGTLSPREKEIYDAIIALI